MLSGFVFLFSIYLIRVIDGQAFHNNNRIDIGQVFLKQNIYYKPNNAPAPSSAPKMANVTGSAPETKIGTTPSTWKTKPQPASTPSPPPARGPKPKAGPKLTRVEKEITRTVNKLKLTINGKRVNPNTRSFKTTVASYLYGQPLQDRVKVWESMATLHTMIAKANKRRIAKSPSWEIEDVEGVMDDIILTQTDIKEMIAYYSINPKHLKFDNISTKPRTTRGAIKKRARKWRMPIQYKIRSSKKRPVKSKPIKAAIRAWEKDTCIRFKRRGKWAIIPGPNLVFRYHRKSCRSRIGMKPFFQSIWLAKGCQKTGIVIHEIGHALGFYHEHQRPDRNKYISVNWKNISFWKWLNFIKLPKRWVLTYGYPYDYSSIMHYSSKAFCKKPKTRYSIVTHDRDYMKTIGQRIELSFYDKKVANRRYCNGKCKGGLAWSKCRNGGYKNPNKCSHCICPDGWRGRYCTKVARSKPNKSSCGKTSLSAKSWKRSITSPRYHSSGYTSKNECSWKIRAPPGKKVRFRFTSLKLHCARPCKDFVEVRYRSTSRPGPRFCCTKRPKKWFVSRGRTMLIIFRTFSGKKRKGFKAEYRTKA